MHRRPDHKDHGGLWEFPGGKVEMGETPAVALAREIGEELGIFFEPGAAHPIAFAEQPPGEDKPGLVILLYKVAVWRGEPSAREEGADIAWHTPSEIELLDRPPLDRQLCAQIFAQPGMAMSAR